MKSYKKGYSLIEIVIYIGVFSMISIVVINSFIISLSSSKVAFAKRNLLEAGNSTMERISREIRIADSIVDANSVFGSSPGVLELSGLDELGNPRTVKFQIDAGGVNMYEGGGLYGSISGTKTNTGSLFFRKITTASGKAIKIELIVHDDLGYSANFYDTVALRGAY